MNLIFFFFVILTDSFDEELATNRVLFPIEFLLTFPALETLLGFPRSEMRDTALEEEHAMDKYLG